jgi:hypothetical protein
MRPTTAKPGPPPNAQKTNTPKKAALERQNSKMKRHLFEHGGYESLGIPIE